MTEYHVEEILQLTPEELKEISRENFVSFSKESDEVRFAKDSGYVALNSDQVRYRAFLLVDGKLDRDDEDTIREFANAYYEFYMKVAKNTIPVLSRDRLYELYQDHSLDAGIFTERNEEDIWNPDLYLVTWLHLGLDENFKWARSFTDKENVIKYLVGRLTSVTSFNKSVYSRACESYKSNPFFSCFKNKELKFALPKEISEQFQSPV